MDDHEHMYMSLWGGTPPISDERALCKDARSLVLYDNPHGLAPYGQHDGQVISLHSDTTRFPRLFLITLPTPVSRVAVLSNTEALPGSAVNMGTTL